MNRRNEPVLILNTQSNVLSEMTTSMPPWNSKCFHKVVAAAVLLVLSILPSVGIPPAHAGAGQDLNSLIGRSDSILVTDPEGRNLYSKNEDKKLVPASILKIFTALVALHYLKPDYRYATEFYLDGKSNLKIKGFGDPLLISEIVNGICRVLSLLLGRATLLNDLILDDSYFEKPLTIPGISSSAEPYDAPNGALCVNFNTVHFKQTAQGYLSAESQTPLLPYAEEKIKTSGIKSGRIVLSHIENENTIYAGKLFQHFLLQQEIRFTGKVKMGRVDPAEDKLIFRYASRFSLEEIIAKLLEHSNNFTTNQLLISSGASVFGPPGNLEKGVAAAKQYAKQVLQIQDMTLCEGSGISRQNRISAAHMLRILKEFEPHHQLLRRDGHEYYKTGTLNGIQTRAGYFVSQNGGMYRYAVMINTAGKSMSPVMHSLLPMLK